MSLVVVDEVPLMRAVPADVLEPACQVQRRAVGELARGVGDVSEKEGIPGILAALRCGIPRRIERNRDRSCARTRTEELRRLERIGDVIDVAERDVRRGQTG